MVIYEWPVRGASVIGRRQRHRRRRLPLSGPRRARIGARITYREGYAAVTATTTGLRLGDKTFQRCDDHNTRTHPGLETIFIGTDYDDGEPVLSNIFFFHDGAVVGEQVGDIWYRKKRRANIDIQLENYIRYNRYIRHIFPSRNVSGFLLFEKPITHKAVGENSPVFKEPHVK